MSGNTRAPLAKWALSAVFLVFLCAGLYAGARIIAIRREYTASAREYARLRQEYSPAAADYTAPGTDVDFPSTEGSGSAGGANENSAAPSGGNQAGRASYRDPGEINQDYVGWLNIPDTSVSFPVVQAENNEKYLDTSFEGRQNRLGAVFMDYRCRRESRHIIVYGHNGRGGAMFGALQHYLQPDYLEKHRHLSFINADGTVESWRIFSANRIDAPDAVYPVDFFNEEAFLLFADDLGAPAESGRIFTMSTCTGNVNSGVRLILHAAPF